MNTGEKIFVNRSGYLRTYKIYYTESFGRTEFLLDKNVKIKIFFEDFYETDQIIMISHIIV